MLEVCRWVLISFGGCVRLRELQIASTVDVPLEVEFQLAN